MDQRKNALHIYNTLSGKKEKFTPSLLMQLNQEKSFLLCQKELKKETIFTLKVL